MLRANKRLKHMNAQFLLQRGAALRRPSSLFMRACRLLRCGVTLIGVLVDLQNLIHAVGINQILLVGFPLGVAGAAVPEPKGFLLLDVVLKVGLQNLISSVCFCNAA